MMKFKSIRMRTIALILPLLVLILAGINTLTFTSSRHTLEQQIVDRMNHQLNSISQTINNNLLAHSKIPELLARQIELSPNDYSLKDFENMLKKAIPSNESTFGGGIFF